MIRQKVCMLGTFAVGKTSLVRQFVSGIFSEKYLTTVGVKIDRRSVELDNYQVDLVLWDLQGDDEFQRVRKSYLRGASGYLLVADGTRTATLDQAHLLHQMIQEEVGKIPFLLLVNKDDLKPEWEIEDTHLNGLRDQGWEILRTSAKTGNGVEAAFQNLARMMMPSPPK